MATARHFVEERVEFNGEPVGSVRKAFARAVADAQLAPKVTPHTLRHTAITWALQGGATVWEAAEFFGVSQEIIDRVYGHHCPARHKNVGIALTRRGRRQREG
jgi:integrase